MTRIEQNRIVAGAAAAMTAIVLVAAAWVTWRHTRPEPDIDRAATPIAAAAGEPDIAAIVSLAPFGGGSVGPATTLGLVLRATMVSIGGAPSSAVIAAGDQPAVTLYPGQAIGGAVLDSVAIDHVILRVGGRTETLAFPRETDPAVARPTVSAQTPTPVAATPTAAGPATATAPAATAASSQTAVGASLSQAAPAARAADPVAGSSVVDRYRQRSSQPAQTAPRRPLPPLQRPGFARDARPGE